MHYKKVVIADHMPCKVFELMEHGIINGLVYVELPYKSSFKGYTVATKETKDKNRQVYAKEEAQSSCLYKHKEDLGKEMGTALPLVTHSCQEHITA